MLGVQLLAPGVHHPVVAPTFSSNPGDVDRRSYISHVLCISAPPVTLRFGGFWSEDGEIAGFELGRLTEAGRTGEREVLTVFITQL